MVACVPSRMIRASKVHTVWDLGWNDAMTIILAQRCGRDSHHRLHRGLAQNARLVRRGTGAAAVQWGYDWLPHDGNAKTSRTGKSAVEILKELWTAGEGDA